VSVSATKDPAAGGGRDLRTVGIPTHLQPWHADRAPSGNGFEVNLVPDYKILHEAGYNALAYDLRNHGMRSAANGGVTG